MLPQAASEHYLAQQRLTAATLALTRREWAAMGAEFDASWATIGPRITLLTASAQLGAARGGAAYVRLTLAELGQSVDPQGEVDPRAFAGIASDGRPLGTLLDTAVIRAKQASQGVIFTEDNVTTYTRGATTQEALRIGGSWLDMAVHTAVADASRGAAGVAIAARPKVGWIRMVNPPCCSRCAVLSGKWFKWNQGFRRHPKCDCYHIPAREMTGELGFAPEDLILEGKVTGITKAEQQAIGDGADAIAVINARRGAQGMFTNEGTTRRGYASYIKRELAKQRGTVAKETTTMVGRRGFIKNYPVRRTGLRPTPEAIYKYAASREEALKLLAQNGYFVGGSIRDIAASAL